MSGRRTKEDSSITKVHKKRWTNQKAALLQVSGNYSSLRNASKTLRLKSTYTYFPNILTMNHWRLRLNLRMSFKSYYPIQGIALLNSSAKTSSFLWLFCFRSYRQNDISSLQPNWSDKLMNSFWQNKAQRLTFHVLHQPSVTYNRMLPGNWYRQTRWGNGMCVWVLVKVFREFDKVNYPPPSQLS